MSHTHVKFSTDGGKTVRELPDTEKTDQYLRKLSHAAIVRVEFDTGEWWEMECGAIINRGGMYQGGN
jgi:hypothetical protein